MIILQVLLMLAVPLLLLKRRDKGLTGLFGTIAMAYVWGIVASLILWGLRSAGVKASFNEDVGQIGSYACIGLAIPLLMFTANLQEVRRLSKTALLSFSLVIVAVMAVVLVVGHTSLCDIPSGKGLAAMAVGMYTGGSPNFNAAGVILGVPENIIAQGNLSDMIVGTVFYIFLLTAAKPLYARLLDKKARRMPYLRAEGETTNMDTLEWHGFSGAMVRNLLLALGCVAIGGGIGVLIWQWKGGKLTDPLVPAIMIAGTVLGLALSFSKKVRAVQENGILGHYLILVFSFALASTLDISGLNGSFLRVVLLLGVITVGSTLVHAVLSRIFRIDTDCTIVTLTAGLYGPAFILAITKQLKNDSLTAPGLICGALGYAVGTVLASLIYFLL